MSEEKFDVGVAALTQPEDFEVDVEPEVCLFMVHDEQVNMTSPIFEAPSEAIAVRNFNLKTLKELPEGFDRSKFSLYKVGIRRGLAIKLCDRYKIGGGK